MTNVFTIVLTACGVCPLEGTDESWIEALGVHFRRAVRMAVGAKHEDELKTIEVGCTAKPGEVASRAVGEKACAIVVSQDCDGEFLRQLHESPVQQRDPVPIFRLRLVPCLDATGGEAKALICETLTGFGEDSTPTWVECQTERS